MAITLTFDNYELGGEIDFNTSNRRVLSYPLATPTREDQESVTETIRVWFDSSLQAAIEGDGILRRLGQYFVDARERQKQQTGERIYIKFEPYSGAGVWRSEILDGRILYPADTLNAAFLESDKGEVAFAITRKAYWEM